VLADLYELAEVYSDGINRSSKPGFPFNLFSCTNTNKKILERDKILLCKLAACRAYMFLTHTQEQAERWASDPFAACNDGICSPVSTFLKGEPHKRSKVEEGRFRVINALDLVDQLVERILFNSIKSAVEKEFPNAPAQLGLGISPTINQVIGGRYERINSLTKLKAFMGDVRQWDASASMQALHSGMRVAHAREDSGDSEAWKRAGILWCHLRGHCLYQVSGYLYVKKRRGQMPSGTMLTTWLNCFIRTVLARLCGSVMEMLMGDDCGEWNPLQDPEAIVALYKQFAVTIRDYALGTDDAFSFCSHEYTKRDGVWVTALQTWPKSLFGLLTCRQNQLQVDRLTGVLDAMDGQTFEVKLRVLRAVVDTLVASC